MTRSGSLMGASRTRQIPSGKSSSSAVATCKPRRVLPTPPVPVRVSRRTSGCRRSAQDAATSCSRPTSGVSCAGKLWVDVRPGSVDTLEESMNSLSCITAPPHKSFLIVYRSRLIVLADTRDALSNVRLQLYSIFDLYAEVECLCKDLYFK